MIANEEKILEWDDEAKILKIRREPIRKIVLEKACEYEKKCKDELIKLGIEIKENIINEGHIAFLTEFFARYIHEVLLETFGEKGTYLLYSEKGRELLIKELNEMFERKLREYLDKAGEEVIKKEIGKIKSTIN